MPSSRRVFGYRVSCNQEETSRVSIDGLLKSIPHPSIPSSSPLLPFLKQASGHASLGMANMKTECKSAFQGISCCRSEANVRPLVIMQLIAIGRKFNSFSTMGTRTGSCLWLPPQCSHKNRLLSGPVRAREWAQWDPRPRDGHGGLIWGCGWWFACINLHCGLNT